MKDDSTENLVASHGYAIGRAGDRYTIYIDGEIRAVFSNPETMQVHAAEMLLEIDHLRKMVIAAKHLILAATGPNGGPTDWNETRDRWMKYADEVFS